MNQDCDTCKYAGNKIPNERYSQCDRKYSNWTPREEKKIKELKDKSGHNILKIYQFPGGFKGRTVVLYPDKKFRSWNPPIETTEALKRNDRPEPIEYWLCERFGQLAQECLDGKHEQYCVWRKEEVNNNKPEPFWIVWCPTDKINTIYQYNSKETAEKQAEARALERRHDKFFVMRVDSRFRCQEVVKTEYKKD